MVLDSDGTATAWALADRNVLVEGRCALNRGLVDLLVLPDVVSTAVTINRAQVGTHGLVAVVSLHDVVFHQRVGAPAVHGEDTDALGGERTAVGDRADGNSQSTTGNLGN